MISQSNIEVINISTVKFPRGNRSIFKDVEKENEKICIRCKKSKSLSHFSGNINYSDGKWCYCKECTHKYRRIQYYKELGKNANDIEVKEKYGKIVNGKKLCSYCRQWKVISLFSNHYNVGKFQAGCKECKKLDIRIASKIAKLEFMLAYGRKCICCGETEIDLLTVEHIKGKGHKLIYANTLTLIRKLKEQGWPIGYEVRCYNCNCATKHGRPCVHTKEYKIYEEKLESVLVNDKRLNRYNELITKLNERRGNESDCG